MPAVPVRSGAVGAALPGLVVGGTGSHAGKTTLTLALLCALRQRGLAVAVAKAGPDFIDAGFHARLADSPAANLDAWMCRQTRPKAQERVSLRLPAGLRRLVCRLSLDGAARAPDLLLVEGAMGLFDGGHAGAGSTALLAMRLGLPVLLAVDAQGLGQSVAALAEGFLRHCPPWAGGRPLPFLGMVCTRAGGERHARLLRQALLPLARQSGVPLLGVLPRQGAPLLASRHLGLVEAREALPGMDAAGLARWMEAHCDVASLLRRLGLRPRRPAAAVRPPAGARHAAGPPAAPHAPAPDAGDAAPPGQFFSPRRRPPRRAPLLAMAWDEAFSFCYADLPALLTELGARVVTFSPLHDAAPPRGCAGLYFPGGYPELHAAALAANRPMLAALRALAGEGLPMYGECGGYMYLMESIAVQGRRHAMCGLLPRACAVGESRAALGYRAALALPGWPGAGEGRPLWVRGHEFHYARELCSPTDSAALWQLYDSGGAPLGEDGCRQGSVAGSWLHCYPEGARRFWGQWLRGLSPAP